MASGYSDLSEIRKNGKSFGGYQKPPKIDLLNEKPRRESIVEQQLKAGIVRQPMINYNQKQQVYNLTTSIQQPFMNSESRRSQDLYAAQEKLGNNCSFLNINDSYRHNLHLTNYNTSQSSSSMNNMPDDVAYYTATNTCESSPTRKTVIKTIKTTTTSSGNDNYKSNDARRQNSTGYFLHNDNYNQTTNPVEFLENKTRQKQVETSSAGYYDLTTQLEEKEAKLKKEINYFNQHYNPWSRPKQFREPRREPPPKLARNDQRWVREVPTSPTFRSNSRISSAMLNTTEQDLLEKAEKLLKDVQEIENKPLVTQQILIESGARGLRSSSDNNQQSSSSSPVNQQKSVSSIHTAIIGVPRGEIDNKSPLPFSYDNFSTLGVRGNIASVGAAPPEKPYAPIFPMIKRTPSPTQIKKMSSS